MTTMAPKLSAPTKVLLVLRIPPPYGGGEIIQEALRKHYLGRGGYRIITLSARQRDKGNQGIFRAWKLIEFFLLYAKVAYAIFLSHPQLIFFAIGKGFPHFFRDSLLVWLARLLRVSVIIEVHGHGFYFFDKQPFCRWYARIVLSHVLSIRVLGETPRRQLAEHFIDNAFVIENGVEGPPDYLQPKSDPALLCSFLFVGTISIHKGFDLIVDACIDLREKLPSFHIHCMGEWMSENYKKCVETRLKREQLESFFTFHGVLHSEEKWNVFRKCDVFVLPSYNEGQPLVILEAFSFGLPVIATNVGAIPDTVEIGKNGFLINPGDKASLGDMMFRLAENKEEHSRIREANRRLFSDRYTLPAFLDRHENWLSSCMTRGRKP